MRPRNFKTMNELLEEKFKFHAVEKVVDSLKDMDFGLTVLSSLLTFTFDENFGKELTPGRKRAFITDTNHVTSIVKKAGGKLKYLMLKEIFISDYKSFMLNDKTTFLQKRFERKILKLVESGIARKIIEDYKTLKKATEDDEP